MTESTSRQLGLWITSKVNTQPGCNGVKPYALAKPIKGKAMNKTTAIGLFDQIKDEYEVFYNEVGNVRLVVCLSEACCQVTLQEKSWDYGISTKQSEIIPASSDRRADYCLAIEQVFDK